MPKFSRYQYLDLATKKNYNNSKKKLKFFLFDLKKMYSSNQYPNILLRCSYRDILARIFKCNSRISLDMQKQAFFKILFSNQTCNLAKRTPDYVSVFTTEVIAIVLALHWLY